MAKGGLNTRALWENGFPKGYACECPFCNETNEAHYDDEKGTITGQPGQLVWYSNRQVGKWCAHATGAYSGGRNALPQFLFE